MVFKATRSLDEHYIRDTSIEFSQDDIAFDSSESLKSGVFVTKQQGTYWFALSGYGTPIEGYGNFYGRVIHHKIGNDTEDGFSSKRGRVDEHVPFIFTFMYNMKEDESLTLELSSISAALITFQGFRL